MKGWYVLWRDAIGGIDDVFLAKDLNFIVVKPLNFITTLQEIWEAVGRNKHHEDASRHPESGKIDSTTGSVSSTDK